MWSSSQPWVAENVEDRGGRPQYQIYRMRGKRPALSRNGQPVTLVSKGRKCI